MVLGPGQRGVSDHVGHNVRQLVHFVHDLVHVDAVVIRDLLVIAISRRKLQKLDEKKIKVI